MPLPAIITGGAMLGSALIGSIGQNKANKQNMAFAAQQAQNQMDFQERMINAQNQYNTPLAQMNRFKEAGLNPHLIYGKGSPGNWQGTPSGAKGQATAQNVFQSMGLEGVITSALQVKKDIAAIKNAELQNESIGLKNKYLADTLGYRTQSEYHKMGILSSKEKVDRFSEDERILSFELENQLKRARESNISLDSALKQQTNELQKNGLTWSDPKWMRILVQQAIDAGYPPGEAINWFMQQIERTLGSTIGNINPF